MDEKEAEARPLMGTIFLVMIKIHVHVSLTSMWNSHREFIGNTENKEEGKAI